MPSLNSPFEIFEPYTFVTFVIFTSSTSELEAIKALFFTKSSFDKEANDTFINEVFFSINKHFLTIWAVIYANIK